MNRKEIAEQRYNEALKEVAQNGLFSCTDLPYRDKIIKGGVGKIKKTLEEFADGKVVNGKVQSLSDLARSNGLKISFWTLTVLYPEVAEAIRVAELTRAERFNEEAVNQLFDDSVIDSYARNDLGDITGPGVNLLKARSELLSKQAEISNKGKFGKAPDISINIGTSKVDSIESIEDLSDIQMIDLKPIGKRQRTD